MNATEETFGERVGGVCVCDCMHVSEAEECGRIK